MQANLTKTDDILAAIQRNKVLAQDSRFDAQMRGMFRKVARSLERQLGAPAANMTVVS